MRHCSSIYTSYALSPLYPPFLGIGLYKRSTSAVGNRLLYTVYFPRFPVHCFKFSIVGAYCLYCFLFNFSSSVILLDWHADCSHWGSITIDSSRRVKRQLCHSQNPCEIRREGVFCCPPWMEPPANRTQADAFHAGFQAFLENVLVPDCLLYLAPGSHF